MSESKRERDDGYLFEMLRDFERLKQKNTFDKSNIDCGVYFVCKRGLDCMELEKCGHSGVLEM